MLEFKLTHGSKTGYRCDSHRASNWKHQGSLHMIVAMLRYIDGLRPNALMRVSKV